VLLACGREALQLGVDRAQVAHETFELLARLLEKRRELLGCHGILSFRFHASTCASGREARNVDRPLLLDDGQ
jgi:hypothetical protein